MWRQNPPRKSQVCFKTSRQWVEVPPKTNRLRDDAEDEYFAIDSSKDAGDGFQNDPEGRVLGSADLKSLDFRQDER